MKTITISVKAIINGTEVKTEVNNPTGREDIQEALLSQFEDDSEGNENIMNNILPDIESDKIEFSVTDWGEVSDYENLCDLETLYEVCIEEPDNDFEIISAGIEADIPIKDINEAYTGEYDSDEDFAESVAEETCEMPKNNPWPFYCIDWERAARDLMMDYSEAKGHYFRNF